MSRQPGQIGEGSFDLVESLGLTVSTLGKERTAGANRQDLVDSTQAEIDFLQTYLPEQMSEDEIRKLAQEIIQELDATSPQEMGQVMKALMPKVAGQADGKLVSHVVKSLLTES